MRNWLLHGLHFGLTLSLLFVVVLLFGCKKIAPEGADFGPAVNGQAIDAALNKAVEGASLDSIHVGQFLDHTVIRRLENEENTMTLGGTRIEVIDRVDTETIANFTLRISKSQRLNGGEFETRVSEETLPLKKSSFAALARPRVTAESLAVEAKSAPHVQANGATRKVTRVTYHNLRETSETLPAPKAVAARPDCGGISPCALNVKYVRFDMVQWYDDGGTSKVSLDFGFSVQPPFLPFGEDFDQFSGLMVIDCRSTYVPVEGRTVFVRDCMALEDFQK